MQHIDNYNYFYTKYYSKAELLIKNYLLKNKKFKLNYHYSIPKIQNFINKYLEELFTDEKLKLNSKEFRKMWDFYECDKIEECLNYEMKQIFFDNQRVHNRPITPTEQFEISYNRYVKELAIQEVLTEILYLLTANSSILEMQYKLNDFSKFDIRDYGLMRLEDTEIFKSLSNKLYPISDDTKVETTENVKENQLSTQQKTLLIEKFFVNVNWSNLSERKKSTFIAKYSIKMQQI